ncbi:2Fe-2S iron-sulfur cluster binding domain-containing protein [Ectothiorhodospiraceae bacterium WFHF3C12]|nr:2Fe-2S iron-sulfur cluster binding domain-containing protein [Ectothiorhodospiraceae bacterium WFHF3C12]
MGATRHRITILDTGEVYTCPDSVSVLKAMAQLGRKGIPSGCHGGGCGVCKVQVVSGEIETLTMSRTHVSEEEERAGFALACRCYPGSDVSLKVVGKMQKAVKRPYGFV